MPMIAFEGCDAAGKASQSKLLAEKFSRAGQEAVVLSFPRYETKIGAMIKDVLTGKLSMRRQEVAKGVIDVPAKYAIDSWTGDQAASHLILQALMHVDKYDAAADIDAHLRAGRVVICDRWKSSAVAYGAADGLSIAWLIRTQELLRDADLNIFLNVSEQEALRRRPKLQDRYEKDRGKQLIVAEQYKRIFSAGPAWVTIDGEGPISTVQARVWAAVEKTL